METEPPQKKSKVEVYSNCEEENIHGSLIDFGQFQCDKILKDDPTRKLLALQASVKSSLSPAVVVLEKPAFTESNVKEMLTADTALEKTFHNDIYGNYMGFPNQRLNGLKVTVIHPATEKHIDKWSTHESYLLNETPELYRTVVLPHLQTSSFNIQWVYNILSHRSEAERIVYEDGDAEVGFVLLPDLKWDGSTRETLYLCAIVQRRDLRSLRDLRAQHLPLLRNIWTKGTEAIAARYGVPACRQRVYLHYQPSYYHLHVHFTSVRFEAPGTHVGKAHLLPEVISNIELVSDYYARATLSYYVRHGDSLVDKLRTAGYPLTLDAALASSKSNQTPEAIACGKARTASSGGDCRGKDNVVEVVASEEDAKVENSANGEPKSSAAAR